MFFYLSHFINIIITTHNFICSRIRFDSFFFPVSPQLLLTHQTLYNVSLNTCSFIWFNLATYISIFTLFEPFIVIYICKKNQKNHTFFINVLIQLYLSLTCFDQPSVHLQEGLPGIKHTCHRPDCLYKCMT